MSRWTLTDPVTSATMTFVHNPNAMDSVDLPKPTATQPGTAGDGRSRGWRRQSSPTPWSFKGFFRTKAEIDTFLTWQGKSYPVHLTDHYGRVWNIWLLTIAPDEAVPNANVPWRGVYTVNAMMIGQI